MKAELPQRVSVDKLEHRFIKVCISAPSSKELDKVLLDYSDLFVTNAKTLHQEATIERWTYWYWSRIFHYVYLRKEENRDREQDRDALVVEVLHSILNQLLFTDGINALSALWGFAGTLIIITMRMCMLT
jgi:hypothetical protein